MRELRLRVAARDAASSGTTRRDDGVGERLRARCARRHGSETSYDVLGLIDRPRVADAIDRGDERGVNTADRRWPGRRAPLGSSAWISPKVFGASARAPGRSGNPPSGASTAWAGVTVSYPKADEVVLEEGVELRSTRWGSCLSQHARRLGFTTAAFHSFSCEAMDTAG